MTEAGEDSKPGEAGQVQNNSNEQLIEDIQSIKNNNQSKDEKSLKGSQPWLPEEFQNTGDSLEQGRNKGEKSKINLKGKRYKTSWEAGDGESKPDHYDRARSPNNRFRENQKKDFQTQSHFLENRKYQSNKWRESNKGRAYGKDRNYKQYQKPWERNKNESTDWKWDKFNKSRNYNRKEFAQENDNEVENDNEDRDRGQKRFEGGWESRKVKYNTWKQEVSGDGDKNPKTLDDEKDKNIQEPQERTKSKHVNWETDNQHRSRYTNTNSGRYGDGNNSWRGRDKNNRFHKSQKYSNDWEWKKQNRSRKHDEDDGNDIAYSRDGDDGKHYQRRWDDKKRKPTNWEWEKRGKSPYGNRKPPYDESRNWKSDKYVKGNRFKPHDSDQHQDFEESDNEEYEQRSSNRNRKPPYKDSNKWKSDLHIKENRHKSKASQLLEDFRDSDSDEYERNKDSDKENRDATKSRRDKSPMMMVKRREWGAPKTKWGIGPSLEFPLKHIFCLPTEKQRCYNEKQCTRELLYLTNRHMKTKTCPDIKYSFFIGTDGTVYECRGWRTRPGLPKKYEKMNKNSLFIALAGTFNEYNTPPKVIGARDYVIKYGLEHDMIAESYILHSAVDHSTMRSSDVDYDQGSQDQESQAEKTRDQENHDQETKDGESQDQETQDQDSQDQETQDQQSYDQESEKEDKIDNVTSTSYSSVETWESYSSSWDLSEGDLLSENAEVVQIT